MPLAGGPYYYLREGFGPDRWGRPVSFIFLWGSLLVMPLVAASVAATFSQFTRYLYPELTTSKAKIVAALACSTGTAFLYRDIRSVGRLSISIWIVVLGTAAWIIVAGIAHFDLRLAFDFPPDAFQLSRSFFSGLGAGAVIVAVTLGGYGTVCLCAGEIRDPARVLPRSILISLLTVGVVAIALTVVITAVVPWREVAKSSLVVSDFIERLHGQRAAAMVTALVLWVTAGCLFTSLLSFFTNNLRWCSDWAVIRFFSATSPHETVSLCCCTHYRKYLHRTLHIRSRGPLAIGERPRDHHTIDPAIDCSGTNSSDAPEYSSAVPNVAIPRARTTGTRRLVVCPER